MRGDRGPSQQERNGNPRMLIVRIAVYMSSMDGVSNLMRSWMTVALARLVVGRPAHFAKRLAMLGSAVKPAITSCLTSHELKGGGSVIDVTPWSSWAWDAIT
jgi:hypothetical protein